MSSLTHQNEKNSKNPPSNSISDEKHNSRSIIDSISHGVGKDVGLVADNASKKARHYMRETRHYVKGNPVKGIAFAAAAGLAVGSILTMAARRSK